MQQLRCRRRHQSGRQSHSGTKKRTKLSTNYEEDPYEIIDRTGPKVIVRRGDRTIRRHAADTRLYQGLEIGEEMRSREDIEDKGFNGCSGWTDTAICA